MDIYQTVTDAIVAAIEKGAGDCAMPWHRGSTEPVNALTGATYRGINIVNLWVASQAKGHTSHVWATYKQWRELGAQVRRGERSIPIAFYKTYIVEVGDETEERRVIKWSNVFNADQVDDYTPPETPEMPPLERLAAVDGFVTGTGANVIEGGSLAFYRHSTDTVHMPDGERFIDTTSGTRTENYYAVLMHELGHWTGAEHRLARDMVSRFGTAAYAMEELVAELSAAFLCSKLGITPTVREDHAQYIDNWLQALRSDKKAIFTAAARAQEAVEYLCSLGGANADG